MTSAERVVSNRFLACSEAELLIEPPRLVSHALAAWEIPGARQ
jgi:hypothetical protein